METCKEDGCEKPKFRRGWCNMHYTRWMRYGSLDKPQRVFVPDPCLVDGCTEPAYKRKWCNKHYQRWRNHGDPLAIDGMDRTPTERFWSFVTKTDTCWLWTGGLAAGYGLFWLDGKQVKTHRFAYELLVGPIPDGLVLDHLCRVPACCNPAHLEPVSQRVNILRGIGPSAANALVTHCPADHEYTPENTRMYRGQRHCRACARETWRARNDRGGSPASS